MNAKTIAMLAMTAGSVGAEQRYWHAFHVPDVSPTLIPKRRRLHHRKDTAKGQVRRAEMRAVRKARKRRRGWA